jgi:hypothetical protein
MIDISDASEGYKDARNDAVNVSMAIQAKSPHASKQHSATGIALALRGGSGAKIDPVQSCNMSALNGSCDSRLMLHRYSVRKKPHCAVFLIQPD